MIGGTGAIARATSLRLLAAGWQVDVTGRNPKRVLDRRPAVFLARRGAGVDHPSAAANIAALIDVVAAAPGRRILNSADPDAPPLLDYSAEDRSLATRPG